MNQKIRIPLGALVREFGGELIGDPALEVSGINTLIDAGPQDISFLTNRKYRGQLPATQAAAVILGPKDRDATTLPRIVDANPYAYMAKVSSLLHPVSNPEPGVHATAVVDTTAQVAKDAMVGAHVAIGAGASIAAGAVIMAGSVIGAGVSIGSQTRLYPSVTVYDACQIGSRCIIHSGAVIGSDGFGLAPEGGRWLKVPQVGRVVIEDDVEIGANTTIDRGAFGDTVIEEGAKLDNQIQIAHNVRIGAHTAIAACAGIAGSTVVGRHCMIGGAAMIVGHIQIADGVIVSGGTLVSKSIETAGTYTAMWAAEPHREWLKTVAQLRRLESLSQRVRELEEKLQAMERKLP